jgi:hypothetical protein
MEMRGWVILPPSDPSKNASQFKKERRAKVESLIKMGYLRLSMIILPAQLIALLRAAGPG